MNIKPIAYTGGLIFALAGSQAVAAVLPDPFFQSQLADGIGANPVHTQGANPVDDTLTLDTGVARGEVVTTVSTQPGFSATASAQATGFMEAEASAIYYFQVLGPANTQAHIIVSGSGAVSEFGGGGPNGASAYFGAPLSTTLLGTACGSSLGFCGTVGSSFSFATPFTVDVGSVYDIQLSLLIDAAGNGGVDNQFGFIDPLITFDPAFGDSSAFQLVLNDGVGNTAVGTVPELSTWAMMIFGFVGVGLMAYRRKRNSNILAMA